jgi:cytochrome c oxidase cbb3-type subunit 3
MCALTVVAAFGQPRVNAVIDPAVVQRGKDFFGPQCGFCHGQDARGGPAGPDLGRSLLVIGDTGGKELGDFLQLGRPANGMPAFPSLTKAQVTDIAAFLHDRVQSARERSVSQLVPGNAVQGKAFFEGAGRCASCHSVSGDLKGIASRYDPLTITDKIVSPRTGGGRASVVDPYSVALDPYPRNVKVKLPNGQTISGKLVSVSEFQVTLVDGEGQRRSFRRDGDVPQVEIVDPLQAHQDLFSTLADSDLHNLTAYLVTIK